MQAKRLRLKTEMIALRLWAAICKFPIMKIGKINVQKSVTVAGMMRASREAFEMQVYG